MSTDAQTVSPAAGEVEHDQTAQPEQNGGVARPESDDGAAGADQPQGSEDDKGLSDDQKAIRKLQRRIDRLTAKRGGVERENELLRQKISEIERQLHTAGGKTDEGEDGQGDRQPHKGRQFTEADIERLAQARAVELQQQTSLSQRVGKVIEAGSKLEGFAAAVDAVAEVVPFTDRQGRPTAFIEAVLETDDPATVLKHLGDNPDEAEDLAGLTPAQLGRRLAKLEDRLKAGAKKQTSAAPQPLKPITGSSAGAEPDPEKDASAWIRARNKATAHA